MSTYKFSNVQQIKDAYIQDDYQFNYLLKRKPFYNKSDKILFSTNDKDLVYPNLPNGLLNTMLNAYNQHIPLKLKPDDLWLTIVMIFMKYIDRNIEKFNFSLHDEQKMLNANFQDLDLGNMDFWFEITEKLRLEIKENTKNNISDLIVPDFSTTTVKDKIIANVSLMSGMRKLFSYGGTQCCGLTEITLEGTEDDWMNLIVKTKALLELGDEIIIKWSELLIPVLEEFYKLYIKENIDEDFWQRICTYKQRGSGDDKNFRGWFLVFGPFNDRGEYILHAKEDVLKDNIYANDVEDAEIADTQVDVSIVIKPLNKEDINVTLFASIGSNYDKENNILTTASDFAVVQHSHITYDMFRGWYFASIPKFADISNNPEQMSKHDSFVKFAHFVAIKCKVPNNMLISLVETLYCNIFYSINTITYNKVYSVLSDSYGQFDKYIKQDQKQVIIDEYLNSI